MGFTLAAGAGTSWVGEAMGKTDYRDLQERPPKRAQTTRALAATAAHLARLLRASGYPALKPD